MRPLTAPRDPGGPPLRRDPAGSRLRRDPAPSRLRYRLTRLWLRPGVRRLVNIGLPLLAATAAGWTFAAELDLRARAAAGAAALREAIVDRPQFTVARFDIPDVSPELAEQIAEAALVTLPVNSLEVNVAAVRERIETLDAVERARVRALPSGALEIRAIERLAVVLWRTAGGLELLDQNGIRVAEVDSRLRRPDLPLIAGTGADAHVPEALALLAEAAAVAPRIRALARMGERRWDLVLDRDQVIKLPAAAPIEALRRVMALHDAEELLARDLTVVDLRDPRRPMLRLSEHAAAELARLRKIVQGEDA
ncbi:cell division protein FtsQ/DivIB [soil metagenome]